MAFIMPGRTAVRFSGQGQVPHKSTPPPGPLPEAERGSSVFNPLRFGDGGSRSEPGGVDDHRVNRMNLIHHQLDLEHFIVGGVSVWTLLDGDTLPAWADANCLSPNEIERCERTNHAAARERFRRGRIILRNVLGRSLGIEARDVPLILGEYGKPMLVSEDWHFNLSHTEGVLFLAVSRSIVGIDVEMPSPGRDIHGLVNRYFTEVERHRFAELPEELQPEAFLRGWTCKEAVLKALGTGVRDLQNVSVELDPRLPPKVLESPGSNRWELEYRKVGEASVAVCIG